MKKGAVAFRVCTVSALLCAGAVITGCSASRKVSTDPEPRARIEIIKAPGVVEHVWEEPMVDVIDVPPGLDPEGQYYRPAHQSIVEIRQGRWRESDGSGHNNGK